MSSSAALGIRYDTGVVIAADTLSSHSNMARYHNNERIFKINDRILFGASGEYAQIQSIVTGLREKVIADSFVNYIKSPKAITTYMSRILGNRREKEKLINIAVILGGMNADGKPYLGYVDGFGRVFEDFVLGSGFANDYCVPLVYDSKPMSREFTAAEAIKLMRDSMKLLFYRHTQSIPIYTLGVCNKFGCRVKGPFKVEENWDLVEGSIGF